jgi:hypothetical protein
MNYIEKLLKNKVMKANAPEKIYLFENIISGTPDDRWLSKRSDDNDIEYIRTDAFIERAKEWFIEHINIPQDVETNEDGEPLADSYIKYAKARLDAANEMFENFKTYMEGE